MGGENFFSRIAESFIVTLTTSINFYSGILQLSIYFLIFITFAFALLKMHHALQVLVYCNFEKIRSQVGLSDLTSNRKTPLADPSPVGIHPHKNPTAEHVLPRTITAPA